MPIVVCIFFNVKMILAVKVTVQLLKREIEWNQNFKSIILMLQVRLLDFASVFLSVVAFVRKNDADENAIWRQMLGMAII